MEIIIICVSFIATVVLGFLRLLYFFKQNEKELDFLHKYNENIVKFIEVVKEFRYNLPSSLKGNNKNLAKYLIANAPKAQRTLGELGIVDGDHQLVINTMNSNLIYSHHDLNFIHRSLIMKIGDINNIQDNQINYFKNPLILFKEGVQFIVSIPILLLYWFGLVKREYYYSSSSSFLTKFISVLVLVIGFISSVLTIILGWEEFLILIKP